MQRKFSIKSKGVGFPPQDGGGGETNYIRSKELGTDVECQKGEKGNPENGP